MIIGPVKIDKLFVGQFGDYGWITARIMGVGSTLKNGTDCPVTGDGVKRGIVSPHFIEYDSLHRSVSRFVELDTMAFLTEYPPVKKRKKNGIAVDGHEVEIVRLNHGTGRVHRLVRESHGIQKRFYTLLRENEKRILERIVF